MADPDTTNPTLTSATLPSVNVTSGGQTVTFSVGALDTGSGIDRVYLYFDHGWQGQTGLESVIAFRDSTDSFSDGVSTEPIYIDPSTSGGTYTLTSAMVYDKAGNWTQYSPADLAALGIPTSFNVTSNASADTSPPEFLTRVAPEPDALVLTGRCYERDGVPYKGLDSILDQMSHFLSMLPRDRRERLIGNAGVFRHGDSGRNLQRQLSHRL